MKISSARVLMLGPVWLELPSPIHSYKPNTSSIRKPISTRIIIPSKANIYIYIYIYIYKVCDTWQAVRTREKFLIT